VTVNRVCPWKGKVEVVVSELCTEGGWTCSGRP
jgi:hypothetical protein